VVSVPKIGARVHGGMRPAACIEIAQAAERNGLAAIWFAENPFNRGVLPAAAASAIATKSMRIGIGVFNPYNRHPTLMAMEIGALDELAGGRAALGIGSGIGDRVVRMGLSYDKPLAAVRDAITIVRGMLRGELVTYEGKVFSVKDVKLEYSAPRPDMPIYMAATGDQALRLCGQVADGLMISNMCPLGYTVRALELLAEGAAKARRPVPQTVIQYVPCVPRRDRSEARMLVKNVIGELLSAYWAMGEKWPAIRAAMLRGSAISEDEFAIAIARIRGGESAAKVLDDRFVDAYAIAGNAEDCLAAISRFGQAGVTDLVLTFAGTQPIDDMAFLGPIVAANARFTAS
jgi:5,10-methylenetetrahydromethanopterin reductase